MFHPCIDLHEGKVKQIVGGTLGDAGLRTQALSRLNLLAHPAASPTHLMLEASWPDAPSSTAQTALGAQGMSSVGGGARGSMECLAGRAAALRFLACVLGLPEGDEEQQPGGVREVGLAPGVIWSSSLAMVAWL